MKKIGIVFLVCVLVVSLFPAAYAAEESPTLDIIGHNITFKDSVFLKYAVDAANVSTDDVKLLVWTEAQDDYSYGTQKAVLEPSGEKISGKDYIVFSFTGLTAKQMTDDVYVRAYAEKDGAKYYSAVDRYSILDYAYSMLGKTGTATTNTKLQNLLEVMLEYGAAAQEYYNGGEGYHLERLATDTFYQISVVDGYLDNGFTEHLYKEGETVNLTAGTPSAAEVFSHWEDSLGVNVGAEETISITVGNANEVYTAVFEKVPSEGLSFQSSKKNGNAKLIGIGDCEDTDVVVPSSYNNYPVVEVIAEAFYGETSITSVTIPTTVTSIGESAFDGCTNLTDIYYLGTTSQWESITLGDDAIPSTVTIHCNDPLVAHYTVTFMDYDGTTVIKTESVAEGSDATPPENLTREGYTFAKWSGNCSNVTEDRTVMAVYYEGTGSAFIIGDAYITDDASQVAVPVYISIKEGITTAKVVVDFDDALSLTSITPSTQFSGIIGAQTYPVSDKITLNWYSGTINIDGDYTFATLNFDCSSLTGDIAELSLSYAPDDICDIAQQNVTFAMVTGAIYK